MGILFVVLGLIGGALIADFAVENHLASAADQTFKLFGNDWHLSTPVLVVSSAVIGAVAIALLAAGVFLLARRLGTRRADRGIREDLESRVGWLQLQTAELQAQSLELADENASLKARLDTLELAPLRERLDTTEFASTDQPYDQPQDKPEEQAASDEESAPEEAHLAARAP